MHYLCFDAYNSLTPGGLRLQDRCTNPFSRRILNLCIPAIASYAFLKYRA